jgi:hypothetical protein
MNLDRGQQERSQVEHDSRHESLDREFTFFVLPCTTVHKPIDSYTSNDKFRLSDRLDLL